MRLFLPGLPCLQLWLASGSTLFFPFLFICDSSFSPLLLFWFYLSEYMVSLEGTDKDFPPSFPHTNPPPARFPMVRNMINFCPTKTLLDLRGPCLAIGTMSHVPIPPPPFPFYSQKLEIVTAPPPFSPSFGFTQYFCPLGFFRNPKKRHSSLNPSLSLPFSLHPIGQQSMYLTLLPHGKPKHTLFTSTPKKQYPPIRGTSWFFYSLSAYNPFILF